MDVYARERGRDLSATEWFGRFLLSVWVTRADLFPEYKSEAIIMNRNHRDFTRIGNNIEIRQGKWSVLTIITFLAPSVCTEGTSAEGFPSSGGKKIPIILAPITRSTLRRAVCTYKNNRLAAAARLKRIQVAG